MSDFLTSPEFLNTAVYGIGLVIAVFLYYAIRTAYRSAHPASEHSEAGRYMIAHHIDTATRGEAK